MTRFLPSEGDGVRRGSRGEVARLAGAKVPPIELPATTGERFPVHRVPDRFERLVLYAYPLTGLPGVALPDGWDAIPGARGCTAEACGFRDHAAELASYGAAVVGCSTQSTAYQREAVVRLGLPFPLLSDGELRLAGSLGLPTFAISLPSEYDGGGRRRLLQRLTLVVRGGRIERVFYPVAAPAHHADEVLEYLKGVRPPP